MDELKHMVEINELNDDQIACFTKVCKYLEKNNQENVIKNKKIICLIIIGIVVLVTLSLLLFKNNDISVKAQIYRVYTFEDKKELYKEKNISEGKILKLSKNHEYYNAKDIEILEITDDYVKISRIDDSIRKSTETITEDIKYDKLIKISCTNSSEAAPKYIYMIKFIKNNRQIYL